MDDHSWTYGQLPTDDDLLMIINDQLKGKTYNMDFPRWSSEAELLVRFEVERCFIDDSWNKDGRDYYQLGSETLLELLRWLTEELDLENDEAGDLASSILQTLDCEWV